MSNYNEDRPEKGKINEWIAENIAFDMITEFCYSEMVIHGHRVIAETLLHSYGPDFTPGPHHEFLMEEYRNYSKMHKDILSDLA